MKKNRPVQSLSTNRAVPEAFDPATEAANMSAAAIAYKVIHREAVLREPAPEASAPLTAAKVATSQMSESRFRRLVLEIGLARSRAIVAEAERELEFRHGRA